MSKEVDDSIMRQIHLAILESYGVDISKPVLPTPQITLIQAATAEKPRRVSVKHRGQTCHLEDRNGKMALIEAN